MYLQEKYYFPCQAEILGQKRQFICRCRTHLQILSLFTRYILSLEIKPHSYCTSNRPGYPTNMPTCLSNASGTLLETTLAILLISIASLVSRVYLARKSTKRQISDYVQTRMDTRQERQWNLASHLCEMETNL